MKLGIWSLVKSILVPALFLASIFFGSQILGSTVQSAAITTFAVTSFLLLRLPYAFSQDVLNLADLLESGDTLIRHEKNSKHPSKRLSASKSLNATVYEASQIIFGIIAGIAGSFGVVIGLIFLVVVVFHMGC